METSSSQGECPEDPASFKGQMAARYKERQSMGFHLSHEDLGERNDGHGEDASSLTQDKDNASSVDRLQEETDEAVQGDTEEKEEERVDKQPASGGGEEGGAGARAGGVDHRRSMKDLITQFERRSHTALESPRADRPETTPTQRERTAGGGAGLAGEGGVGGGLAREAWRGSNRALHMDLDAAADTSSSSSVSMSDDSGELETGSARGARPSPRRRRAGKYSRGLRSASSTNLEISTPGLSGLGGMGNPDRTVYRGLGSEVVASSRHAGELGVSAARRGVEYVKLNGDVESSMPQDASRPGALPESAGRQGKEVLTPERTSGEAAASATDAQEAAVPQPLRVNLKDFAARKKRSSNTGEMKYVVHKKDWRKWMQNHQGPGSSSRQKQPGGLPEGLTAKAAAPRGFRNSALELRSLRKASDEQARAEDPVVSSGSKGHGVSSGSKGHGASGSSRGHGASGGSRGHVVGGGSRSPGSRRAFTSASNTQQRLERRRSHRSHSPSPNAGGLVSRPDGGYRRTGGAMERYLMFLNRSTKHGQEARLKTNQHQYPELQTSKPSPPDPTLDGRASEVTKSEVKAVDGQAGANFPSFSLPSTPSPRRRKDASHQTLQALLKQAHEKERRPRSTLPSLEREATRAEAQSKSAQKSGGLNVMTPSTDSFLSNANTTSTVELEKQMDRALAHIEEVKASRTHEADATDMLRQSRKEGARPGNTDLPGVHGTTELDSQVASRFNELRNLGSKLAGTLDVSSLSAFNMGHRDWSNLDIGRALDCQRMTPGRGKRSLTPTMLTDSRSMSQGARTSYGGHPVRESRSRSSPASVKHAAYPTPNMAATEDTKDNRPGSNWHRQQLLGAQAQRLSAHRKPMQPDFTVPDHRDTTGQYRTDSSKQLSLLSKHRETPRKISPVAGRQNPTMFSLPGYDKPELDPCVLDPQMKSGHLDAMLSGHLMGSVQAPTGHVPPHTSHGLSPTVPRQAIAGHMPWRGAASLSGSMSVAADLGTSTRQTNHADMARMLRNNQGHLFQRPDGDPSARSFLRTAGRRPFNFESPRGRTEGATGKSGGHVYRGVGSLRAERSVSTHAGNWPRHSGASVVSSRDTGGRGHQGLSSDVVSKVETTQGGHLEQQQRNTHTELRDGEQASPLKAAFPQQPTHPPAHRPGHATEVPPPPSSSSASPKTAHQSRRGSPRRAAAASTEHQPSHYPSRLLQRGGSSRTLAKVSSAASLVSRRKKPAGQGAPQEEPARRAGRWGDHSTTSDSLPASSVPGRKKTFGSASRADQTRRRTVVTPSTAMVAMETTESLVAETGLGESHSEKDLGPAPYPTNPCSLEQPPTEGLQLDSPPRIISREATVLREESKPTHRLDSGAEAQGDAGDAARAGEGDTSDLDNKPTCHFGSGLADDGKSVTTTGDVDKKDASSPETSPSSKKRKLTDKTKRMRKKKKKKRSQDAASLTEEKVSHVQKAGHDKFMARERQAENNQKMLESDTKLTETSPKRKFPPDVSPPKKDTKTQPKEISFVGSVATSKKQSPETSHTAGVTSVTIKKRSHSRSPPRISRPVRLPSYRPVRRLTALPTALYPCYSHIPLRAECGLDFLASRRRPDLLAQYRRWREAMVDPERPSRIPLSIGFRWTLDSAVVEEWALHCWEPESGVFMDEQGTWWSSVVDKSPAGSAHASLLADSSPLSMDGLLEFGSRLPHLKLGPLRLLHASYMAVGVACLVAGHVFARLYQCGGEELDFFCGEDDVECLTQLVT